MFFIAYTFKGQVNVFAGRVKVESHSSCRKSAILNNFVLCGPANPAVEFYYSYRFIVQVKNSLDPDKLASSEAS